MHIYHSPLELKNIPKLDKNLYYIYVLKNNPQGNIKIGRSHNIQVRMQNLAGSNNGGNYIETIAVSEPTYLYTLESALHNHFHEARIQGTEWFDGTKITMDEIIQYIDTFFQSEQYRRLNDSRRLYVEKIQKAS